MNITIVGTRYEPEYSLKEGLEEAMPWYLDSINKIN